MAQVPWWLGSWVESHVLMQASWKMWLQAWSWMMEVRGTLGWDDSGTLAASAEWQMLHSVSVLLVWKWLSGSWYTSTDMFCEGAGVDDDKVEKLRR
jgi:hypothetical protein